MRLVTLLLSLSLVAGCRAALSEGEAYQIAYEAIADDFGYRPRPRGEWPWWHGEQEDRDGRSVWVFSVDFAPAGGGDHALAIVDARSGDLIHVLTGHHLR